MAADPAQRSEIVERLQTFEGLWDALNQYVAVDPEDRAAVARANARKACLGPDASFDEDVALTEDLLKDSHYRELHLKYIMKAHSGTRSSTGMPTT